MKRSNQKGQTTVEYLLLIAVLVSVMSTIFPVIEDYVINNPNSLQNGFLQNFSGTVTGGNADFSGGYQRFTIRR